MSRATAVATGAAGLALMAGASSPGASVATLRAATRAPDPLAPLLALVTVVAWCLFCWLLVIAAATLARRIPGRAGRLADVASRRIAPAGVRRLVEVSLGLTVAVGAFGAAPASADTHTPPAPPAVTTSLDWPAAPAPALDWNPAPRTATGSPHVGARAGVDAVVVQPGDSLWAVAAEHLPDGATEAQVAQAWPSWWSANRSAVGADPDLIHPGLQLTPPNHH